MRKFVRFAASFLSALALPVLAADLRPLKEPAQIAGVFSPKAKIRVLNVWAMWCVPCVEEMPDLRAIDASFGPEVGMAGVSLDDMIPDAKQAQTASFLDRQKIVFPNIYYTGNADALGDQLDFNGEIPITIVYDAKGKELYRHQGRIDREKLTARLRDILRRTR
ncbi:MAG TPA: TlpA disulfide reductase family protein [Thermoanaerobaculia bacterium]|nr:TlpA disulfide reductase family protein [Thermoanaerobaculia bacterium]